MSPVEIAVYIIVGIGFFVLVVWFVLRKLPVAPRQEPEDAIQIRGVLEAKTAPATDDRTITLTGRERMDAEIKDRLDTGHCLFCDDRAVMQMPTFHPQRSPLDGLYRMLNVVPLDRYKILIQRGIEIPAAACEKHHERIRGLFEKRIAKVSMETADFFDSQRLNLYVFERYEVYERVHTDMQTAKKADTDPKTTKPGGSDPKPVKRGKKT